MKRTIPLIACLLLLPQGVSAREEPVPVHAPILSPATSTVSPPERFEVVESPLAVRWTFRLDRICGRVDKLVADKDGKNGWQAMDMLPKPPCPAGGKNHYQLFLSGITEKIMLLVDNSSGKTWQLMQGANGDYWSVLE